MSGDRLTQIMFHATRVRPTDVGWPMTAREQATCATCDLMDDGLPCEYHRGYADGAAEVTARVEALARQWGRLASQGSKTYAEIRRRHAADLRAALTGADQ